MIFNKELLIVIVDYYKFKEPYRTKIINNTLNKKYKKIYGENVDFCIKDHKPSEFIDFAFSWSESKEGQNFWREYFDKNGSIFYDDKS